MFNSIRKRGLKKIPRTIRNVSEKFLAPLLSGLQKGPEERGHVKKCQKVSRHFSTTFAQGKKRQKSSKRRQKVFRHFSTFFARHHFSGPFWGALIFGRLQISITGTLLKLSHRQKNFPDRQKFTATFCRGGHAKNKRLTNLQKQHVNGEM